MSQPPEYPGTPADPHGGSQNPPGYPPAPNYGAPPGYGAPPPGYGAPPPGYGSPPPGYGAPPPGYGSPAPGYGAPPSGGYPPASYGAPPAGYPASGYGGQPAQKYSIGEAFTWSWNKLSQNALALIVSYLIYRLIAGILSLGFRLVDAATTNQSGSGSSAWGVVGLVIMIVLYVLSLLVEVLTWTALITGCLDIADGKPVSIGSFFRPRNFAMALVAAFMLAVFTLLGLVLLIIPGMIFVFLASLTLYFVVDRSMTPWDALKASIATVRSNVGDVLLALLATIGVTIVGLIACCVGVIVAVPLNTLIWTYTYRKLSGGYVVPLEQPGYQAGPPPGYQPS